MSDIERSRSNGNADVKVRTLEDFACDLHRPRPAPRRKDLRCGAVSDIQLVCGAGRYEVDVLMRVSDTNDDLDVTGQITRADSVHEPVPDLTLIAFECDALRPVAKVRTDCFGSFELKLDQGGRYALAMGESTQAPCVLLWEGAA